MTLSRAKLSTPILALVVVVSCSPGPDGDDPVAEPSSPVSEQCGNQAEVIADESKRRGSVRGDVTGSGEDEVWLAVDEAAELGCRGFLAVRSPEGTTGLPIDVEGVDFSLGLPAIVGLKQIDATGASDVVVDLTAGASTVFSGVYTHREGSLVQLAIEGSEGPAKDLFAHGGGVAQVHAADCDLDGSVVISKATLSARRYNVTRRTYEVSGTTLVPSKTARRKVLPRRLPARFPEFLMPPFASCPDH